MRKTIITFLVFMLVFTFARVTFAEEMDINTRWQLYNAESKNPWLAVGAAWLVPTLGHAYAGDWGRGLPFFAGEAAGLALLISGAGSSSSGGGMSSTSTIGFWTLIVARIWEYVDAYGTAENSNKKLKEKYNLSFDIKENCPVLALNYNF